MNTERLFPAGTVHGNVLGGKKIERAQAKLVCGLDIFGGRTTHRQVTFRDISIHLKLCGGVVFYSFAVASQDTNY